MICWSVVAIRSSWQTSSVCPCNCIPLTPINLAGHVTEPLHDMRGHNCVWSGDHPLNEAAGGATEKRKLKIKKGQVQVGNGTEVVVK